MKHTEIRIGNYLKWKDNNQEFQVSIGMFLDVNFWNHIKNGDIIPIELTGKRLVKFGYVKVKYDWQGKYHRINELSKGLFTCDKNGIVLIHVHQLQNLYFELTGKEFKP